MSFYRECSKLLEAHPDAEAGLARLRLIYQRDCGQAVPEKPERTDTMYGPEYRCPACGALLYRWHIRERFCSACGKAIDWR